MWWSITLIWRRPSFRFCIRLPNNLFQLSHRTNFRLVLLEFNFLWSFMFKWSLISWGHGMQFLLSEEMRLIYCWRFNLSFGGLTTGIVLLKLDNSMQLHLNLFKCLVVRVSVCFKGGHIRVKLLNVVLAKRDEMGSVKFFKLRERFELQLL